MSAYVHFPEVEPHVIFDRDYLSFPAAAVGKPATRIVTFDLLLGPTGNDYETAIQVFHAHRADLQERARALVHEGRVDKIGDLLITALT